jgi:EpsI family protein
MLAASGLAATRVPRAQAAPIAKKQFEAWVPDVAGPWRMAPVSGVVLPPPDALSDRLYDNLVTRVYEAENNPAVMLAVVYNNIQDGVLQVHRPEFCYTAGGFALSPAVLSQFTFGQRTVPVTAFSATGTDRTEQVGYWTRMGDKFPRNWSEQRITMARANLAGVIPDGAMLRVSVVSDSLSGALPTLTNFAKTFLTASAEPLRRVLVGSSR